MDWYDNKPWWLVKDDKIDCTEGQMRMATDGYFSVESARIISNEEPTISGMVSWIACKGEGVASAIGRKCQKSDKSVWNQSVTSEIAR